MAIQLELRLGKRSPQLYRSWSSIMRYVASLPSSRDARTTMSARSIAHAARCDAAACFARREAKLCTNQTTLHPFEGPNSPIPPSRDRISESPPFEEFPLRGLPFPFPLRGTVNGVPSLRGVSPSRASLPIPPSRDRKRSPLPSRSFPFEGFPDRARPPRLRRAYHDAHAS